MGNLVKILEGPKEPLDDLCVSWLMIFGNMFLFIGFIVASCATYYWFRQ
jgi:hypothetical protein